MKKSLLIFSLILSGLFITSCEEIENLLGENGSEIVEGLSDEDIIDGLKEALKVGTDTATSILSVTDGYFKDQAVKLLLPEEVSNKITAFKNASINIYGLGEVTGADIYNNGLSIPLTGIDIASLASKEDDLILGINRAAEAAAKTAGPIFWDAITGMTIEDGNNILFGGVDTAATEYLSNKTRTNLFTRFEPKIDSALGAVKIGNVSVVESFEEYITDYNDILNISVPTGLLSNETLGSLMGLNTMAETDLSEYSTNKGLDGLFLKVKDEEKKIRENPLHRVTDILEKVFGELDI